VFNMLSYITIVPGYTSIWFCWLYTLIMVRDVFVRKASSLHVNCQKSITMQHPHPYCTLWNTYSSLEVLEVCRGFRPFPTGSHKSGSHHIAGELASKLFRLFSFLITGILLRSWNQKYYLQEVSVFGTVPCHKKNSGN